MIRKLKDEIKIEKENSTDKQTEFQYNKKQTRPSTKSISSSGHKRGLY